MLKSSLLFWFYLGIIIKRVSQARLGDHLCLDIRYSLMPSDFLHKQFHSS